MEDQDREHLKGKCYVLGRKNSVMNMLGCSSICFKFILGETEMWNYERKILQFVVLHSGYFNGLLPWMLSINELFYYP